MVHLLSKIEVCRGPKDNFLLSLSVDGNADLLLTGDRDLPELGKFGGTTIITISGFLQDR
ncbi:MAG: putative toxin-antitoxin system toxin component, PIN family [Chitinophagaceae bacterium]|nr:putative toxin-antitoxin system toxin component, PIN family [Chitinophagaceae bacterium]MCW5926380.1 putative toxin-antitoxin system toxin component, PIN family [Chitinophagaceae bacterium]